MPSIDDKVVAMSFESSKFESGVSNTLSALDKLKAALHFPNAGKGFDDINKAAGNVQLGHIAQGVDDVIGKLSALRLTAIAVFANIASKAIAAGTNFAKSFTIAPIKAGFQEYATNLNAVQTILANTQASGATLKDVNSALLDLNKYSDKTIYNFSQMAKNIGTFTAAGVDLKTSTQAIKGIANLAALSGSNADQASTAMYQLSQAISAGRVGLQDWNSVVNAGMGGTVFQRALAQTAVQMGTLKDGTLKLVGPMKNVSINGESFRQSMQAGPGKKSWLTSGVLTETLKQFTGDLTDAQLKAKGFTDAQIKAIQQTAKTAQHAATEVKTISQVLDVAKETLGSGWAQTFQTIFGDFTESKKLFTGLSNSINGFININAAARNKVLGDWKALGGRTLLINSIKTAFHNLGLAVAPIKDAFREIFPATTGKQLFELTKRFQDFANALKPSPQTVENLKRTFKGLFALLDIGKQVIGGIFTVFGQLFGALGDGSGGFLNFTGNIGDFLVKVDQALKKGDKLHNFFLKLGAILAAPIQLLRALGHALSDLFSGFSSGGVSGQIDGLTKSMNPFHKIMVQVGKVWDSFLKGVAGSGNVIKPAFDALIQLIQNIAPAIGKAASGINFDLILQGIRTGLFAGLLVVLKQFLGKGSLLQQLTGTGGGIFKNLTSSMGSLTGTMQAMQNNLKAQTLKEIAIAIALLAVAVLALSLINPDRLKSAITAMGFMFAELLGAMAILDKIGKSAGFVKLPFIGASLILLAGAIDILVIAVVALSRLSWEQLLKGLTGVGVLLAAISLASIPLSANSSGMVRAGIGITAIAIAMNLLALAVRQFAGMSWTELGKGLAGVGIGLGVVVGAISLMPTKALVSKGASLILIAAALKILAGVVQTFSGMDWQTMGRGMAGIGLSLGAIAIALRLMPKNMITIALGLIGITGALKGISLIVQSFGGMSVKEMAKGLIGLAASLGILAGSLYLMSGSLAGATALAVAAAGLALLAPALKTLGSMSWGSLLKGMIGMAGALGILIGAAYLIAPLTPALLGFGAALLLMGAGLALAGAGIALVGIGLSALVVAAPTGVGILIAALEELLAAVPRISKEFILSFLAIVDQLAATAPKFVDALIKILNSLLDVIIKSSPKIAQAFDALVALALKILSDNQAKIIQAGFNLLVALLQGIKNNIPQLVTLVGDIIVRFLNNIANNLGRIITAGASILISILKGISNNYSRIITTAIEIITKFLTSIASNLGGLPVAGLSILTKLLTGIATNLKNVIAAAADVIVKFITGIGQGANAIIAAGVQTMIKFIQGLGKNAVLLANAAGQAIVDFLNGLTKAVNTYAPQIRSASAALGVAIIEGMIGGLNPVNLYNKAVGIANHVLSILKNPFHPHSPSPVTFELGVNIIQGLINGLNVTAPGAYAAASTMSHGVIKTFNDIFQTASPSKIMHDIGQFVGQGFADGLRGSADNIKSAFVDLNNKLTDAMVASRQKIKDEQDRLDQLMKEQQDKLDAVNKEKFKKEADKVKRIQEIQREYAKPIAEAQAVILENEGLLARLTAGHNELINSLKKEKIELIGLSNDYEKVSEKLKEARNALADAEKTREDAIKRMEEQYSAPPDLSGPMTQEIADARKKISDAQDKLNATLADPNQTAQQVADATQAIVDAQTQFDELVKGKVLNAEGTAVDQLATYTQALKNQTTVVGAYQSTLQQLRKLGLDDVTYQKLLQEGPTDQQFATQLLSGGKTAVAGLNTLDSQLMMVSQTLATNAGNNLYQAGVDAAQGLVNGLASKKSAIRKQMEAIAEEMIRAIRRKLRIKSPSEVFADVGRLSMEGIAAGFSMSTKVVTDAVDAVAQDALNAMRKSIRNLSGMVSEELNPNPVITPVLDLTQVRTQAEELNTLTSPVPITAATSYRQASAISSQQNVAQTDQAVVAPGGTSVKFEQNNYSPEALTEIEIYRQTRNQLSQLRSVLTPT